MPIDHAALLQIASDIYSEAERVGTTTAEIKRKGEQVSALRTGAHGGMFNKGHGATAEDWQAANDIAEDVGNAAQGVTNSYQQTFVHSQAMSRGMGPGSSSGSYSRDDEE